MYKNSEGYSSPTEGMAISHVMKEYRQQQKKRYADKNRRTSKYGGDVNANVVATIGYCRRVIREGYMPIASHLLYPQVLDDNNPSERELGLLFGLALLRMCDEVWVFGTVTLGVASEIEEAKKLKKQIRYFEEAET